MDVQAEGGVRIQVVLAPELGSRIRALAESEHRPIRFQIERLVIEALEARDSNLKLGPSPAPTEVGHA